MKGQLRSDGLIGDGPVALEEGQDGELDEAQEDRHVPLADVHQNFSRRKLR